MESKAEFFVVAGWVCWLIVLFVALGFLKLGEANSRRHLMIKNGWF